MYPAYPAQGNRSSVPSALTQEDFDALRVEFVEQGVYPDLATQAARWKIEARPFA